MRSIVRFARSVLPFALFRRLAMAYSVVVTFCDSPRAGFAMLRGEGERRHRFRRLIHPFSYRLIPSDRDVVMQNIVRGECVGGPLPLEAAFIVDGGGYIGDSAAVFLSLYPQAICLVFEPGSSAVLAERNLRPFGDRAILRRSMLAREPGAFDIKEAGTGSVTVASSRPAGTLEVSTMEQVLRQSPTGFIDILKLDVEGAEHEILKPPTPWLASVRCVIIELHGEAAHRDIPGWLRDAGFEIKRHRSLLFCNRPST